MSATPFVHAFIEWANTFDSVEIKDTKELGNADVFKKLLLEVDNDYFCQIEIEEDVDNWLLSLHNLKRVYNAAAAFYEDVLHKGFGTEEPNLPAIAKSGSLHDIELFARLVVAIAVQCVDRQRHIQTIQSLHHRSQRQLMIGIEEMLDPGNAPKPSVQEYQTITDSASSLIEEEFSKMLVERNEAEEALRELLEKHTQLKKAHRALQQLTSGGTGTAHYDDSAIDYQSTIADLEERLNDALGRCEKEQSNVTALKRTIAELQPQLQSQSEMQTKLDDALDQIKSLRKIENVVEKYKRKLEDLSDVQRKAKSAEEQNTILLNRITAFESNSTRNSETTSKHQMSKFEDEISSMRSQKDQKEAELIFTRQLLERIKNQRSLDFERITELEEQLRDVDVESEPLSSHRPKGYRLASELSAWQPEHTSNAVTDEGREGAVKNPSSHHSGVSNKSSTDTLLAAIKIFSESMEDFDSTRKRLQGTCLETLKKEVDEKSDFHVSISAVLDRCKESEEVERKLSNRVNKLLYDIKEQSTVDSDFDKSSERIDSQLNKPHPSEDINSMYFDLLNKTQLHSITLRRAYEDPISWLAKQRNDSEIFSV